MRFGLLFALCAGALIAGLPTIQAATAAPAGLEPRRFERQWEWPGQRFYRVKLDNVRGRVVLRRWDRPGALVQASLRATQSLGEEEKRLFRTAEFQAVESVAGMLSLKTHFPGVSNPHPAVVAAATSHLETDWRINIPASCVIDVRQEVGSIVGHGLAGRLDVFTRDGDVHLSDIQGRVEVGNERGDIELAGIVGDAEVRSVRGRVYSRGHGGDLRVLNSQGDVVIEVPPRWVGDVSFHTVSGNIYSDMLTRQTDLAPGDRGYEGIMQGPLATSVASPAWRVQVDTLQGNLTVAIQRRGNATSAQ